MNPYLRIAAPALTAFALSVALAAPASAAPSFVIRNGGTVLFSALAGEVNNVTFDTAPGYLLVTDSASTLTAGSGCQQVTSHSVRCGTGVTRIQASLGDRDDRAENKTSIPSDIDGGEGQDTIIGGDGNDRLTDRDGWNSAPSATTFNGRGGNDTIVSRNGGYDRIECGSGSDLLVADSAALDVVVGGCEFITR
ncbi:hypothetical protein [Streptomyces sp. NPDC059072]|uniref:hypothetical protein n=1 Tax=unclassified Streptomyces TaxID=2593676 RepID=UPI0036CC070C